MCRPVLYTQPVKHLKPLTLLESYGLGLFSLGGCTAEEEKKQSKFKSAPILIKMVLSTLYLCFLYFKIRA